MTSPDSPSSVLAPCPFCGWDAIVHNIGDDEDCWYVGCAAVCSIDPCGTFATEYEAIVAWNSRFFIVPPGYPAYVPLPGDPASLSQVPAGQGLSLGQMATTLRAAGMVVTQDHVATPPDEKGEPATKGLWRGDHYWLIERLKEMETAGRLLQKRIKNQRREIRRLLRREADFRNGFALAHHERSDAMARQAVLQKFIMTAGLWNKFCSTLPPLRPNAFPLSPAPEPRNP